MRRRSTARTAVDNVRTVLLAKFGVDCSHYHVHVNFPGGAPVDGPSAGAAMAVAVLSAVRGDQIDNKVAITGELSVHGAIKPVGGVTAKIAAAVEAGATRVLIPAENWQERYGQRTDVQVVAVRDIGEVYSLAVERPDGQIAARASVPAPTAVAAASQ